MALTQAAPRGPAPGTPTIAQPTPDPRAKETGWQVDFARQIKPLLDRSCAGCHSGQKPRGLFRIDTPDAILKGGASGEAAIIPGHSKKSRLIDYVSGDVPDSEMPPRSRRQKYPALKADDVLILRTWIDQGAKWPTGLQLSAPKIEDRP